MKGLATASPARESVAVLATILLLSVATIAQQQTAIVRGTVVGADGRPVGSAAVTLLDELGGRLAVVQTAADGRFRIDEVPPGTYRLFAEASPQRSDARIVIVQGALPVDIDLTLAARLTESVVVQGASDTPPVTTRRTIAGDTLRRLPSRLPSRGIQQMLATLPGWASEDNGLLHVRGVDDGFLYVEDGIPVYDRIDTVFGIAPDPASIGSVNVLTGYIPPEYGLKAGAVIEVQSSAARQTDWAVSGETGAGSEAQRSARGLAGGPLGDRATIGLSVAAERSDRFLDPVHPDNFHNAGGVISGQGQISMLPSDRDLVRVRLGGGRSRYQVPHGEAQEDAGQDQRQRLRQDAQSGSWQRFWSDAVVTQVALYRRHVRAALQSSADDTPLSAASDREQDRLGVLAGLTYERGRHTLKVGVDAARLALGEDFRFAVTDEEEAEEAEISEAAEAFTPDNPFRFADRVTRGQWSFYAQDRIRATDRLTLDLGIRFDRTNLLIPTTQWSPRAGVALAWPETSTTLRASVNRFLQPPQAEHLLLSSSAAARALSPFAEDADGDEAGGAELEAERQTAWEVGVDQWFGGRVRVDAAVWARHVRNYADPNVFFGTTIIFPNSVASGTARGVDVRLELARARGWSSYVSYTLSKVEQIGPINGGLFLEDNLLEIGPGTRFTPDHDQRHVSAAGATYQHARGFAASLAARYESGTPLEVEEDDEDELMERPGAERVNFEIGRVRPRLVIDLALSQRVYRGRRADVVFQFQVLNLTDRAYALNFGNPFSGTHFGAPRTMRADLKVSMR